MQISTIPVAADGVAFSCSVSIIGGSAGDIVRIRLAQVAGGAPLYSERQDVPIAADGTGMGVFQTVVLYGINTEAVLVADDIISSTPILSATAHVSVR